MPLELSSYLGSSLRIYAGGSPILLHILSSTSKISDGFTSIEFLIYGQIIEQKPELPDFQLLASLDLQKGLNMPEILAEYILNRRSFFCSLFFVSLHLAREQFRFAMCRVHCRYRRFNHEISHSFF
jgi:hypothetical protein